MQSSGITSLVCSQKALHGSWLAARKLLGIVPAGTLFRCFHSASLFIVMMSTHLMNHALERQCQKPVRARVTGCAALRSACCPQTV